MPFLNLDRNWSNLAQYYNQNFNNKPEIPAIRYTSFDDGLIRGGVVNATLASVRDTARIGKFIASGKGVSFITKQIILQATNPKLEASGSSALSNRRTPNQIYNLGLNTLTQIPLTAFGGHVIRQGTLPVFGGGNLEGSDDNIKGYNYEKITLENNIASTIGVNSTQSVITNLNNQAISNFQNQQNLINKPDPTATRQLQEVIVGEEKLSYVNAPNRLLQHLTKLIQKGSGSKTKGIPVTLLEYNGGANSIYGVGKTRVLTYPKNHTDLSSSDKKIQLNGFVGTNYRKIDSNSTKTSSLRNEQSYIFPSSEISSLSNINTSDEDIETRLGVSKVGAYKQSGIERSVDAINTINIVPWDTFVTYASGSTPNAINANTSLFSYTKGTDGKAVDGYFGRDIIKFRIEFLNNNNNQNDVLAFRAYIDDFQDGMQARWNSYRYMGRGEDFYVYDGFTRDVSVSFTIYAHSPEEMRPLYRKLNFLMSTFAPDYNSLNKMRGNIAYLTVGDYLYRQPGVFTDIKLSGMLDTHWEIALNEPEGGSDNNQYEVPKHIKVSLSFKPIHDFLPRKAKVDALENTPFITRNKQYGANKYFYQENKSFKPLTKGEHESLSESERQARSL